MVIVTWNPARAVICVWRASVIVFSERMKVECVKLVCWDVFVEFHIFELQLNDWACG